MIKLMDLIPDKFKTNKVFSFKTNKVFSKEDIVKQDTWTHTTYSKELVDSLLRNDDFIGKKEDIKLFNVPDVGPFGTYVNQHAPNFLKGKIFHGFETNPYLITTDLSDDAFQPNWNAENYDDFKDSSNVGVLKPEYRDSKYFKIYGRIGEGKYVLISKPEDLLSFLKLKK